MKKYISKLPRETATILTIVLIALAIRLWGVTFGLPYMFHPDEPNKIMMAQNMFKTGDLNPHYFKKPTLFIYINALAYIPYYLIGKWMGVFSAPSDILPPHMLAMGVGLAPYPTVVLMGRLLTVFIAAVSVLLIYLIGKRISGKVSVGLLAAVMMSISPTNVINSRYITTNAYLTFFALIVLWTSIQIYHRGRVRDYALAGIAFGFAVSCKYPVAIIVLVPMAAHFLRFSGWRLKESLRDGKLYLPLVLGPLAFLATTPYAVLDYPQFLKDVLGEFNHYSQGHYGMEGGASWYLIYMWKTAGILYALAALAIVRGILARSRTTILLSVFPLAYLVFISSFVVKNDRTFLPISPFLFLLAASFLLYLWQQSRELDSRAAQRISFVAVTCIAFVGLVMPTHKTIITSQAIATVDSRTTASVWISENLPQNSKIGIEAYAPYMNDSLFFVDEIGMMINHDTGWYIDNEFDYLVFSEGMYARFYRDPGKYSAEILRYEELFNKLTLVEMFNDGGYEVRIYAVE